MYPADSLVVGDTLRASLKIELDRSCTHAMLGVMTDAKPLRIPTTCTWAGRTPEFRTVDDLYRMDGVVLISAGDVAKVDISDFGGKLDQRAVLKAIVAYFAALPPDWPVVAYYI